MELEPGLNSDPQVDEAFRGLMDQSGRSVLWDRKFIGGDLTAKSLTRETEMVGTQKKKEKKKVQKELSISHERRRSHTASESRSIQNE